MTSIAQTYPGFAVQVTGLDWTPAERALVRRAYDEAAALFAGAERGSGKPFIDHLVGTASGVVVAGGGAEVVAAALLHAAYDQGDFGDGRGGPTRRHRARLAATVGADVEDLVHRYHLLGWSSDIAERELDRLAESSAAHRSVLMMRVANQVDDVLDAGLVISGKDSMDGHRPQARAAVVALAERLGLGELAEIAGVELGADPPSIPHELILGRGGSSTRLPASARQRRSVRRPAAWALGRARVLGGRVRRRLGSFRSDVSP